MPVSYHVMLPPLPGVRVMLSEFKMHTLLLTAGRREAGEKASLPSRPFKVCFVKV